MIIISWNCRGFGNQLVVDVLTNMVRSKGPTVVPYGNKEEYCTDEEYMF